MMNMNVTKLPWMLMLVGMLGVGGCAFSVSSSCDPGDKSSVCQPYTPTPVTTTTCNGMTGIDTSSDPMHCGSCDKACTGNEICMAGACTKVEPKIGDSCSCSAAGIATNVGPCLPVDGSPIKVAYRGANMERYPILPPETRCVIQQPDTWATTLNAGEDSWGKFQGLPSKVESGFTFRTSAGKVSLLKAMHNQVFALDPARQDFGGGTWFIWGQSSDGTLIQGEICRSIRNMSDCVVP